VLKRIPRALRRDFTRWEAAQGLLKLAPRISNREQIRHAVRALRCQVTNVIDVSREAAFVALEQLCVRLAELDANVSADRYSEGRHWLQSLRKVHQVATLEATVPVAG